MITIAGIYEHYRTKKLYRALGVGLHTETGEIVVIYQPLYPADHAFFARPQENFEGLVDHEGQKVLRFRRVE